MPTWAWLGLVWLTLSVLFALGIARWFKFLHDEDDKEHSAAREWHG